MKKSRTGLVLLAMLKLTLSCQSVYPQTVQNLNLSCLSREQKDEIAICFAENDACHEALEKGAEAPPRLESFWKTYALLVMGGLIGGMILSQQVRH